MIEEMLDRYAAAVHGKDVDAFVELVIAVDREAIDQRRFEELERLAAIGRAWNEQQALRTLQFREDPLGVRQPASLRPALTTTSSTQPAGADSVTR